MTDRELPDTAALKATAEQWKTALEAASNAEDAAWDAPAEPSEWRRLSHRTVLIEAVVTTIDEVLAKIALLDEADHPIPYSPITPPWAPMWPHFDPDAALGDLLVDAASGPRP